MSVDLARRVTHRVAVTGWRRWWVPLVLSLGILVAGIGSFCVGRYPVSPVLVFDVLAYQLGVGEAYWEPTVETVIINVRLPRIGLAMLVGAALASSSAAFQTLFKNPMVSPDLLGVSAGAGFGAALAMVNGWFLWQIQVSALVFGLLAVLLATLIGVIFGRQEITVLVLGGIVVGSFFQALISIVKTMADTENALPSITFWLMGSLSRASIADVVTVAPAILLGPGTLFVFRYQIDTLAAGEDEAATLGVRVGFVKAVVVVAATTMTVAAVAATGIIGWIGLVVPHIARSLVGSSFPSLLGASVGTGALFLLVIDNILRGIAGVELPLGVLTALIGTPLFVVLLTRVRKGWK